MDPSTLDLIAISQRAESLQSARKQVEALHEQAEIAKRQISIAKERAKIEKQREEIEKERLEIEKTRLAAEEAERDYRRQQDEHSKQIRNLLADSMAELDTLAKNFPA